MSYDLYFDRSAEVTLEEFDSYFGKVALALMIAGFALQLWATLR